MSKLFRQSIVILVNIRFLALRPASSVAYGLKKSSLKMLIITVLLPIYSSAAPMKAEAIEEVTVSEDYDDSHVEFLEDVDYTEDGELWHKNNYKYIEAPLMYF